MTEKSTVLEDNALNVVDQNKAIYRRYILEVFNEGRLDRLEYLLSPTYVYRDPPPGIPPNVEGVKQVVINARKAFPDLEITIDDIIGEGDKVCARVTTRGTHHGLFFDISATGKTIAMKGFTMIRIVDGLLVESWVQNDVMGLMHQLGATSKNPD